MINVCLMCSLFLSFVLYNDSETTKIYVGCRYIKIKVTTIEVY